ncbi:MAG: FKBP-type peptidyl-prolyl cis-trans isomerase [Thermoanaerobaculia bacterium]|nr:FKBP-type peptidyl-prolyl cis-trans isomerase [Thermoanaerobaculia bacterium]
MSTRPSLSSPLRLAVSTVGTVLLLACPALSQTAPDDLTAPPEGAERTESGLVTRVLETGNGDVHPGKEDLVRVHYTGWTSDGEAFESTAERESPPTLPVGLLIPGWSEGLGLMVEGETRRMWIPESLAFAGEEGRPAGTLVFDVELVELIDVPEMPDDVAAPPAEAEVTKSGLASVVLRPGDGGEHPKARSRVQVHYTGWTTDGEMFDTSIKLQRPVWFKLTEVIRGWKEGIQLMTRGEVRRFWVPEKLAYKGARGKPEGMLVFEVELLDFNDK